MAGDIPSGPGALQAFRLLNCVCVNKQHALVSFMDVISVQILCEPVERTVQISACLSVLAYSASKAPSIGEELEQSVTWV